MISLLIFVFTAGVSSCRIFLFLLNNSRNTASSSPTSIWSSVKYAINLVLFSRDSSFLFQISSTEWKSFAVWRWFLIVLEMISSNVNVSAICSASGCFSFAFCNYKRKWKWAENASPSWEKNPQRLWALKLCGLHGRRPFLRIQPKVQ